MKYLIILVIRFYKIGISPYLPSSCRFYPTCSEYAMEAVRLHGAGKGSWLAMRRILRCHPFNPGGFDPVPCNHDHKNNLTNLASESTATIDLKKHYEIL